MKRIVNDVGNISSKLIIILFSLCFFSGCNSDSRDKPNVLFIAVDDLRTQLNCYGSSEIISPNIDRLAEQGVLFNRAYCQTPICMVSRSSLMTGFRPDHNNLYDLRSVKEAGLQDFTINRHFEKNGYAIWASGKIYHYREDSDEQFGDNYVSKDGLWYGRGYVTEKSKKIVDEYPKEFAKYSEKKSAGRGPAFEMADVPDSGYYDGLRTNIALEKLKEYSESDKPFFMAVGYRKPHLPFNAPLKYWNMYPRENIELADNNFLPKNFTEFTKYNFRELRNYYGIPKDEELLPDELSKTLIQGYNACVTYIDAQIGRLLEELDDLGLRENTIVVLWSDHGWKLGEHGMWCKHTTFELDCRIPLIISYPGQKIRGIKTDKFAELVDIYPTLCQLAGLDLPDHLQGSSLVPLMENPEIEWKAAAFTEWPLPPRKDPETVITGYTIKTDEHRYVEWTRKSSGEILDRELYDHEKDLNENHNIASYVENRMLVDSLSTILNGGEGWKSIKDNL